MTTMTTRDKIRALALFLLVLSFIGVVFAFTFFLTGFIYQHFNLQPTPFLTYMVNIVLALFFCFLSAFLSAKSRSRNNAFSPIIEAIQKMAKGDFSIQLEDLHTDNPILSQLTQTVNYTAVELNKMEKMRQEFISNVSHELQSPLTSIRGFARALQNNNISADDQQHYLAIIESESIRLSRITENLLKLAALEAEHAKFEPQTYALDKQIRDLILACEPQWTEKSIEIDVLLDNVSITADQDLLSQVWTNLLSNSIKFTPFGGRLGIMLKHEDDHILFTLNDSGIGISADDQAHVFERFYKADKSRTHSTNTGSGLGLSIAKKIIDMHNGTITVQSTAGVGTRFTITLPAAAQTPPLPATKPAVTERTAATV